MDKKKIIITTYQNGVIRMSATRNTFFKRMLKKLENWLLWNWDNEDF